MEFGNVDTYQVTLGAGVTTIDASSRSGCGVVVKNMNASGGNVMYIGPAANRAGGALSATTGYPLAGQESLSVDLTLSRHEGGKAFSVIGTQNDKLAVLVLHP
jgi:hypothetical protein